MSDNAIKLLAEYLERIKTIDSRTVLKDLNREYMELFRETDDSEELELLKTRVYASVSELVMLREERNRKSVRQSTELSEAEHAEILRVQKLIDFNLFTYHFQPIVRVDTGEIYSYEALMRAKDMQGITPYHILKYAEMTDRLAEVEQYTFLNVLHYIDAHKELFEGKLVFINSMPNVHIAPERSDEIGKLLDLLSDKVVVEMTENSEYKDEELNEIKEKYRGLNIRIAIDDYGTGYSNISNLLRYTPNYVKIDRSLLSGIQNNPNKKHFVREIIDFCHDNRILALAEGVENSEDLRTVILLGADLIQGFYTARPSAEVIQSLPFDIRAEIRSHRQEREDGRRMKIYTAEKGEKIMLDKLFKEGYTLIRVGMGVADGTVTVTGTPYIDTGVHIETAEGFNGMLVLDSVRLSNVSDKPCIDIGANSRMTLRLCGSSKLENSGIRVPESSLLRFDGDGNLAIHLGGCDYYGIGNDLNSGNGALVFEQDGTITIGSDSHSGVCIGSGNGGRIDIRRGRYVLKGLGSMNVCIGSFNGDAQISMLGCDVDAEGGGAHCAVIGSVNGSATINVLYSSIKCNVGSIEASAFGTVTGENATVRVESANIVVEMRADATTAFGALVGRSDIRIERSSAKVDADGAKALVFGGVNGDTELDLNSVDVSARIASGLRTCFIKGDTEPTIEGGKFRIRINGTEYDDLIILG